MERKGIAVFVELNGRTIRISTKLESIEYYEAKICEVAGNDVLEEIKKEYLSDAYSAEILSAICTLLDRKEDIPLKNNKTVRFVPKIVEG